MRRGFTLVETLVAMLLTSLLVLSVFGGLTFVGRGYRRDELAMARAQVAQSVSELLGDDLRHLDGTAMPSAAALASNGYEGSQQTFVAEVRRGAHQVATWPAGGLARQGFVRAEYAEEAASQGAGWTVQTLKSRYRDRPGIDPAPMPWGAVEAAFLVPLPSTEDPDVMHLALSTRAGARAEQVLWSFWRHRRGKFDGGQIMRYGAEGPRTFTRETPLVAKISLVYEWVRLVSAAGTRVAPVEARLELDLREPGDLVLPFVEPQFRVHRVLSAGL